MTAWHQIRHSGVETAYSAPGNVRAVLAALGRTEDIRFSPDNRRLALAAFNRHRIAVFDIDITASGTGSKVALTRVAEVCSAHLKRPHGLDFIDDETLVVANRDGDACIFKMPSDESVDQVRELSAIPVMRVGSASLLEAPGSVWVDRSGREVLICNNASSCVTRHVLDRGSGYAIRGSEILLQKWLDLPDGVTVSRDRRWIAVSNHNAHNVLLFENTDALSAGSDPLGILRGAHYPHGLRFCADDRFLVLADAAAPYVHVYAKDDQGWRGVRSPVATFRVMDDALFQRGRNNPQEGGPKGLDIDAGGRVLAVTSECQPLAFFDLPKILETAEIGSHLTAIGSIAADPRDGADPRLDRQLLELYRREQQARQVRYELEFMERTRLARARQEASLQKARTRLAAMKGSLSWRLTKPLRRIASALRRDA
jgi:hypothetical protein